VQERYGGSAAAELDTYTGAVTQAGNAWEDFQKAIGETVVESPLAISAIKQIAAEFRNLSRAISGEGEVRGTAEKNKAIADLYRTALVQDEAFFKRLIELSQRSAESFVTATETAAAASAAAIGELKTLDETALREAETTAKRVQAVKDEAAKVAAEKAAEAAKRQREADAKEAEKSFQDYADQQAKVLSSIKDISEADARAVQQVWDAASKARKEEIDEIKRALDALDARTKEGLAEAKAEIEAAASNPISFVIKLNSEGARLELDEFAADINEALSSVGVDSSISARTVENFAAGIAGGIDAALNGKEGARSLISGAAGAFLA
jgi:hypothetical protein